MALKLVLLMYYKNGRGHNFRRQVECKAVSYVVNLVIFLPFFARKLNSVVL